MTPRLPGPYPPNKSSSTLSTVSTTRPETIRASTSIVSSGSESGCLRSFRNRTDRAEKHRCHRALAGLLFERVLGDCTFVRSRCHRRSPRFGVFLIVVEHRLGRQRHDRVELALQAGLLFSRGENELPRLVEDAVLLEVLRGARRNDATRHQLVVEEGAETAHSFRDALIGNLAHLDRNGPIGRSKHGGRSIRWNIVVKRRELVSHFPSLLEPSRYV